MAFTVAAPPKKWSFEPDRFYLSVFEGFSPHYENNSKIIPKRNLMNFGKIYEKSNIFKYFHIFPF